MKDESEIKNDSSMNINKENNNIFKTSEQKREDKINEKLIKLNTSRSKETIRNKQSLFIKQEVVTCITTCQRLKYVVAG